MDFTPISRWLDDHVEEMVDLQRELTAIAAINPESGGTGEWKKAGCLESYLAGHGFPAARHYDTPDERVPEGTRPNLTVVLPGRSDRQTAWVVSHTDVVPPGDRLGDGTWAGWQSDPYTLRREGDRIIGRGVEDNQQALVASVFAARALLENSVRPDRPAGLAFVAGEETGSAYGLQYLLREHPDIFGRDDVIIIPDAGSADGSMIEVAEKSILWLTFHVKGRQSHGSKPNLGRNAFRAAARLVCALDEGLHRLFDEQDDFYEPPACSTFEPTVHEKNVPNVNTIPGEDVFSFDCRVLPKYDLDEVLGHVRSQMARVDAEVGTHTELRIQTRLDAATPTPPDAPVVVQLRRAVKAVYGVEGIPRGIGGGTFAALLRKTGRPAAVWSRIDSTAHQANEYCKIANMVGDAKVYAHVFLQEIP